MAYTSAYTDFYQDRDRSGESYDRSVGNRFELAILRLEHVILRDLFRRLRSSDPSTTYLDFACGTGRIEVSRFHLLPTRWLVPLEAFLSRIPVVNRISKNQIYVCRRTQPVQL